MVSIGPIDVVSMQLFFCLVVVTVTAAVIIVMEGGDDLIGTENAAKVRDIA